MKQVFSAQLVTDEQEVLVPAKALCIKDGEQGSAGPFPGKTSFNKVTVLLNQEDQVELTDWHGQGFDAALVGKFCQTVVAEMMSQNLALVKERIARAAAAAGKA